MLVNRENGKNTAPEGYILGFASVFFCSANMRIDEQEQTRSFILSPECTEETVRAGIEISVARNTNREAFLNWLNSNEDRRLLKDRILYIKSLHVGQIDISDGDYVKKRFYEKIRAVTPAMQRKIKHFMSLIKGIALLNAPFRMNDDGKIVATNKDVDEAAKLWEAVSESMFYGLPPQVIDFYKNYVLPAYLEINEGVEESRRQPVTTNQICMFYYNRTQNWPNPDMVNKMYIPILEGTAFIECIQIKKEQGGDGRQKYIIPQVFFGDELEKTDKK